MTPGELDALLTVARKHGVARIAFAGGVDVTFGPPTDDRTGAPRVKYYMTTPGQVGLDDGQPAPAEPPAPVDLLDRIASGAGLGGLRTDSNGNVVEGEAPPVTVEVLNEEPVQEADDA